MVSYLRRLSCLISKQLCAFVVIIVALTTLSSRANADVLFEGYSKILLSGTHVGFIVQRYEFDPKKKEFSTISYLKTNQSAGNITESLKARANASLNPISYQYTELSGNQPHTIDASFKGEVMTLSIQKNGKKQKLTKKIPKGAFLSSFLGYLMLQGKEGIKTGVKYGYQAVAEEDGNLYTGEAFVSAEEAINGISAFKVLNTFKGSQFVSYVTHKGEVIATRSPVQQLATELVATIQEATAGLSVNNNNLAVLFGAVPRGVENAVARKSPNAGAPTAPAATSAAPSTKQRTLNPPEEPTSNSPKQEGVPAGQGIVIKNSDPSSNGEAASGSGANGQPDPQKK